MPQLVTPVPVVLGVIGAAVALLLGAWGRNVAGVAAAAVGLLAGAVWIGVRALPAAGNTLAGPTGVLALPAAVCLALGAAIIVGSSRTLATDGAGVRSAALAAIAASAAAAVSVSTDLLMLFIGVETLALSGYGLVAAAGTQRAREATMKWFVQGSVATVVFIAGLAAIVGQTGGTLTYRAIAAVTASGAAPVGLSVGVALVIAALAFKAGAFPFHSWMPDAFETGPAPAVALLASVGKIAPLAAAVWLLAAVSQTAAGRLAPVLAVLSLLSIVFGNLAALRQRSLARMLAYSGIAQVGYAIAGLLAGEAALATIVFVLLYSMTSAASFLFIVAMSDLEPAWDGRIAGLAGLSRRRPMLAAALAVVMFSLTGIPLTAGFWGKFVVFTGAASAGYTWLAVVAMLFSVVSFGFYGNVLRVAFMAEMPEPEPVAEAGAEPQAAEQTEAPADTAPAPVPVRGSARALAITVGLAVLVVATGVVPFLAGMAFS